MKEVVLSLLTWVYYDNSVQAWLTAAVLTVAAYLLLWVVRRVAIVRLHEMAQKTSTQLDNMVKEHGL